MLGESATLAPYCELFSRLAHWPLAVDFLFQFRQTLILFIAQLIKSKSMCAAKTYPLKHEEAHSYYNFNTSLIPLQATRIHFYIDIKYTKHIYICEE